MDKDTERRCVGYKGKCHWALTDDEAAEIEAWRKANPGRPIPYLCGDHFQQWKRDNALSRGEQKEAASVANIIATIGRGRMGAG